MTGIDTNMRILVVDDSNTMRRVVVATLKQVGFTNVTMAEDGQEAWDILQKEPFELVLCDYRMPRLLGVDLLKLVRNDPKLAKMPFIMITAESMPENVVEAAKFGVSGYIVKPFSSDQIKKKIAAVFNKS